MSQQGYMGHDSTDGGDRSGYGNGGYNNPYAVHNPYWDANPSSYEDYIPATAATAAPVPAQLPMTPESPAFGLFSGQLENGPNTIHQSHHGHQGHLGYHRSVAAATVQALGSLPESPTTPQSYTSNIMPGVAAAPNVAATPALSASGSTPAVSAGRQQEANKVEKNAQVKKKEKAKNGQAKNPFLAKWYSTGKLYSDLTCYHKITIPGLLAFLRGEGVDVDSAFPAKAKYYLVQEDGSHKELKRGWAIVQKVKMVHQRVIDLKKTGANMGPLCGEGENNDNLLVDTGSTGYVSTALGEDGSVNTPVEEAFEGDSADGDFDLDDEPVTANSGFSFHNSANSPELSNAYSRGGYQALGAANTGMDAGVLSNQDTNDSRSNGFGRATGVSQSQKFGRKTKRPLESDSDSEDEGVAYAQSNHQRAARPVKMQRTVLNTNTRSTQPAGTDILIIVEMFNGLKKLQERCMAEISHMTLQSVQDGIRAFDAESATTTAGHQPFGPGYTANTEGTVLESAGEIIISVEVQELVKRIVAAEGRYLDNEAHRPAASENDWEFEEEQNRIGYEDYQVPRTALIQRLETDLNWTIDRRQRRQQIIEAVEQLWPRVFLSNRNSA